MSWNIIGWIILIGLGAIFGLAAIRALIGWATQLRRHYRTRNIEPQPWQVWVQDDARLTVTRIAENGRICLSTATYINGRQYGGGSSASWSDSPEQWRARVKSRRLWLMEVEKP